MNLLSPLRTSLFCSFLLALLCLSSVTPAHAGLWLFTLTGTMTASTTPVSTPPAWNPPVKAAVSTAVNYNIGVGNGGPPGQTVTASDNLSCPLHVAVTWAPTGTLAADPQPTVLRLSESGSATWSATGSDGQTPYTTGSGTAAIAGIVTTPKQYPLGTFTGLDRPVSGNATSTLTPPANGGGTVGVSTGFTYSVQVLPINAGLTVDQDQQVLTPAVTTRFSATVGNAASFTIDWIKISVDNGTPVTATIPAGSSQGYIDWPQTGGNPSEHTVTATAQIHDSVGTLTLNSTDLPGRQYATSGMGRPADIIIADLRLKSLKFNSNIALAQDASTNVPSPEFTWTGGSSTPATANPAAYVQGSKPNWTLTLASSSGAALNGNATMGYLLKVTATPNTTNPSTHQADPALTLSDNTTGSPAVPTVLTSPLTLAATTALNSWVATYTESFPTVTFFVKFTKLPTPVWRTVSSYGGSSAPGNTLYAVLATPTAPMAKPWVSVLGYACDWAKRTTSATNATAALVSGEYNTFNYDGNVVYTDLVPPKAAQDGQEVFNLQHFLTNTAGTRYSLTGDCRTFADFLCCTSGSIGALSLQVQRSSSADMINNNPNCNFSTNNGFQAHPIPNQYDENVVWHFHQWAVSSSLYDGAFQLATDQTKPNVYPTALTPLISSSISDFYNKLVEKGVPTCWNPQPAFLPTVAN